MAFSEFQANRLRVSALVIADVADVRGGDNNPETNGGLPQYIYDDGGQDVVFYSATKPRTGDYIIQAESYENYLERKEIFESNYSADS